MLFLLRREAWGLALGLLRGKVWRGGLLFLLWGRGAWRGRLRRLVGIAHGLALVSVVTFAFG